MKSKGFLMRTEFAILGSFYLLFLGIVWFFVIRDVIWNQKLIGLLAVLLLITIMSYNLLAWSIGSIFIISETGIKMWSIKPKFRRDISWEEISWIQTQKLTMNGPTYRGDLGDYYIISVDESNEPREAVTWNMEKDTLLCIPITPKTNAVIKFYCLQYPSIIIKK